MPEVFFKYSYNDVVPHLRAPTMKKFGHFSNFIFSKSVEILVISENIMIAK